MVAEGTLHLAIDQGGHASRALVFGDGGHLVAESSQMIETHHPRDGWVEHDPEALIRSVNHVIADVLNDLGPKAQRVTGAGLATQRSSIVCWDRTTGRALSPVLSWQDRRAESQVRALRPHAALVRERTGLMLSAHYGATKLRWCLDHLQPVRDALDRAQLAWGPLASFILFRILEEHPLLADPSTASRTLLWDVESGDWSAELLDLFGLPRGPLPECAPSRHAFGHLPPHAHAHAGAHRIAMTVVTGDQAAALWGYGEPSAGEAYVNVGTGAFVQRWTGDEPIEAPRLLRSIVWRDAGGARHVLEGAVNGAGAALALVESELGVDSGRLVEWLEQSDDPPLFLNGVGGLGSPFWVADFPSRFVGEGAPSQKLVAVVESVVFLLQANLQEMAKYVKAPERLVVSGGLAALDGFCRRLADLSRVPVMRQQVREATARGLAFLVAARPDGWAPPEPAARFAPQTNTALDDRYRRWCGEMMTALGR